MDESTKNSPAVKAALEAIKSENIEMLTESAAALDKNNEALSLIASYLSDASEALANYELYK